MTMDTTPGSNDRRPAAAAAARDDAGAAAARDDAGAAAPAAVYLDYQATTPTDPRVVAAMLPLFSVGFGNPHSRSHGVGRAAEEAVEAARRQVAALIGADPREVVFTSGATESNNLAIKGAARFRRTLGDGRDRVVTVATEHKCVLESCRRLAREGFDLEILPVGSDGLVDLDRLARAVTDRTALVSVMAVNNEIGVIQPIDRIARLCRERGALVHCDAAQAAGKIPVDVAASGIDLMSLSAHKLYGPKGIGALYVRRRPRVRLDPLIDGGGQERGLRSGTLPAPLCVGFGAAAALAGAEMATEAERLRGLRDRLLRGLTDRLGAVPVNGHPEQRIPGNLNVAFPGIDSEELLAGLGDVAVSTGSACTSAAVEPSYVLRALGLDAATAGASVRIGLGRFTTAAEVDYAAERIAAEVLRIRRSPPGRGDPR